MSSEAEGYYNNYEDDYEYEARVANQERRAKSEEAKRRRAIKLIAGHSSPDQVQNKIIKQIFRDGLDDLVERYAKRENLSIQSITVAREKECLEIIIKGFLKRAGGYTLSSKLKQEISEFCEILYRNDDLEIVYDRVSRVQKFIYKKIKDKNGAEALQALPVTHMKNLLSTARLHLNIYDINYKDVHSLTEIFDKSKRASDLEKAQHQKVDLLPNKRFIKGWKVVHLMPLINYQSAITFGMEEKINYIARLDTNININDFKEKVLDVYLSSGRSLLEREHPEGLKDSPYKRWRQFRRSATNDN